MNTLEDDVRRCVDFHGHLCPGLALGIVAARAGLEELGVDRSHDEEVVSCIETDACCADAVQVISGSTFGKGNFMHKDVGKVAMTFISRDREASVRLCLKPGAIRLSDAHRALMDKVMGQGSPTEAQHKEFWRLHNQRAEEILHMPWSDLFSMTTVAPAIPPKAVIEPSALCDRCGEPVMASKLKEVDGSALCLTCRSA
ncbi:FmdE family protein [Desulfoluna butyratoxydans]|uniref:Zinc finger dksa/trar c4-type n=1 Tax=Desulfoluna butyratoxydans TaxID=231438 RepID=A0A4U8YTJ7_9BACT|nr:FmdE family protein [Desulfoluna butyratoxydans]VFQ44653.1 zinc finger dksa/trar c4-type [Desulfoluna butyratoxydans]